MNGGESPTIRFSFLGDSITVGVAATDNMGYADMVVANYPVAAIGVNHGVGGAIALTGMDSQVAAASADNANIIIMAFGTNDDNGGNMAALQAEIEENIVEIAGTNPLALIYYLNVLPKWTDNTGVTEIDKSNIRTAVAAACAAQSITCWDTYTVPWIDAADTTDGTHPTDGGHGKVKDKIISLLS